MRKLEITTAIASNYEDQLKVKFTYHYSYILKEATKGLSHIHNPVGLSTKSSIMFDSVLNVTMVRLDLFYCVKTTWLKSWKLSPAPNKFCVLQVTVIIMTDDSDPDLRLIKLVLMHSFLHREDWKRKFFLLLDFFILKTFYTNRKMGFVYLFWTFNVFIVLEKTKGLPRKLFTSNWNLKVSRWFVFIKKIAGLLSFSAPRR